jgi:hypothetical protein
MPRFHSFEGSRQVSVKRDWHVMTVDEYGVMVSLTKCQGTSGLRCRGRFCGELAGAD